MAKFNIKFFSNSLIRPVPLEVVIPNDPRPSFNGTIPAVDKENMKCIFLLHGYTGDGENWIPEYLLAQYNCAVVCPSVENGFYLDGISTGHAYQTFVGVELVNFIRNTFGLAMTPEKTFTMGMSMGGFGAIHTALAYPDTFGKCVGLSSALIIHKLADMKPGDPDILCNYEYYRECFGDLATVKERDVNPEVLALKLKQNGIKIPSIYMACGLEDFLSKDNQALDMFFTENNIEHVFKEDHGEHDMNFWGKCVPDALKWLCE